MGVMMTSSMRSACAASSSTSSNREICRQPMPRSIRGPSRLRTTRFASLGDRVCGERAGSCQPANRCFTDIIGPGQVGLDLTSSNALQYFSALVRRQLVRPAEADAASLGADATLISAFADQLTLELSDATEDRNQQTPVHRRCVGPRILERAERRTTIRYLIQQVQQIAG